MEQNTAIGAALGNGNGEDAYEAVAEVQMDINAPTLSRKRKQQRSRDDSDAGEHGDRNDDGGDDDDHEEEEEGHYRKVIRLAADGEEAREAEAQTETTGATSSSSTTTQRPLVPEMVFYANPGRDMTEAEAVPRARRIDPPVSSTGQALRTVLPPPRIMASTSPQPSRSSNGIQPAELYRVSQNDNVRVVEQSDEPEEEYICPVCRDLLVRPVTLGCGHTCCQHCLIQWVDTKRQERSLVPCPAGCQQIIPAAIPGVSVVISSLLKEKYPAATISRTAMTEEVIERWRREQEIRAAQQEQRRQANGDMGPFLVILMFPLLFLFKLVMLWSHPTHRGRPPRYVRLLALSLSVFQWSLVLLGVGVSISRFDKTPTSMRAMTTSLIQSPFNGDLIGSRDPQWNASYAAQLSEGPIMTSTRILANMDSDTLGQILQPLHWAKQLLSLWSSIWGARALAAADPRVFAEMNATSLPNLWDEFENPAPLAFFRATVLYEQPFLFTLHASGRMSSRGERTGFLDWYETLFSYHTSENGNSIRSLCARHVSHVEWKADIGDVQAQTNECARTYTWLLLWMQYEPRLALLLYLAKYMAVNTLSTSRVMYLVATRIILSNVLFLVRTVYTATLLVLHRRPSTIWYIGATLVAYCIVLSIRTLCVALCAHLLSFVVQPLLLKFPILMFMYWDMFHTMIGYPIAAVRWSRLPRADQQLLASSLSAWWHDELLLELQDAP